MVRLRYLRNRSFFRQRHGSQLREALVKEAAAKGKTLNEVYNSYRQKGYALDAGAGVTIPAGSAASYILLLMAR